MPIKKEKMFGGLVIFFALLALVVMGKVVFYKKYHPYKIYRQTAESSMGMAAPSFGVMNAPLAADSMMYQEEAMMKGRAGIIVPPDLPPIGSGSVAVDVPQEDRLIIKTGNMSLVVGDVPQAITSISDYAVANKGFVVGSNVSKMNRGFVGYVTIRVPAETFDASMTAIRAFGQVESQGVNGQDVTEEFVDVEAQLKNLQATEQQFLSIMKQATRIEDILAVQRELTNVRAQIEQLEGRKKYLSQSAGMSTISVNLSTDPENLPVVDEGDKWRPLAVAKDAVRALLNVGKGFVNLLIVIVTFTPVWVGLALIGWLLYRVLKRAWDRWID